MFVLKFSRETLKILPLGLQWPFRIHAVHKSLTVFLAKGKLKKNNTLEMSPHFHFHTAICVDLVKKFNGTKYLFAEQNFQGEHPPSKNFRMSPFTLLSY
jgi:hypothetical protein